MKNSLIIIILLSLFTGSCKTTKHMTDNKQVVTGNASPVAYAAPKEVNFSDQETWILGYFNLNRLTGTPYSTWYIKGFDDYMPKSESLNSLLDKSKDGLTIKIILGTWCPDSRREVPRFMKVLDIWQFPVDRITFIGVDNAKLSPVGEYDKLDIQRVPTFIIYKNNIEAGRIIENPATSLEQDIVNILAMIE